MGLCPQGHITEHKTDSLTEILQQFLLQIATDGLKNERICPVCLHTDWRDGRRGGNIERCAKSLEINSHY